MKNNKKNLLSLDGTAMRSLTGIEWRPGQRAIETVTRQVAVWTPGRFEEVTLTTLPHTTVTI